MKKKKNRNHAETGLLNIHASTTGSGVTRRMRVDLFGSAGLSAVAGSNVGNDIPRGKLGLGVNSVKTELGIGANWMKASAGTFTAWHTKKNY